MPKGVPRDQSTQRRLLHRLKIARGHLDKVVEMAENNEYCIDIVHQSLAVQAALKNIDKALLENHIRHCVAHEIHKGAGEEVIEELTRIINKT
jgi:DNA-binding FrmR family transcriptional regulator